MNEEDAIYKVISQAFYNTQAESHTSNLQTEIQSIFSIGKASEKLRFKPFETKMHNKFLLWHGVKQCNVASILREGVRLPS